MDHQAKIVTQKDVAKHAGVSRSVVSYVLNDGPRNVAPETRDRVLEAIEKLGYHPNKNAQRLKLGGNSARCCLGIVAGGQSFNVLERSYYNAILSGLFEEAHRMGQEVRFFSFFEALTDPVFFNKNIHPDEISSLVLILPTMITPNPHYNRILDQIAKRIDNVVCLEETIKGWPTVIFDRALAAQQAVEHLIHLGHQHIAHLGIRDARLTGYRQSLEKHGLTYDDKLVAIPNPSDILASSYKLTKALFQQNPRPTAIFTASDEIAISAMAALKDQGLRIPQDVAITSIDNIDLASMVRPSLTSVNVPKRRMASLAMQVLMMEQKFEDRQDASIILPTELIVRESCGAHQKIQPLTKKRVPQLGTR